MATSTVMTLQGCVRQFFQKAFLTDLDPFDFNDRLTFDRKFSFLRRRQDVIDFFSRQDYSGLPEGMVIHSDPREWKAKSPGSRCEYPGFYDPRHLGVNATLLMQCAFGPRFAPCVMPKPESTRHYHTGFLEEFFPMLGRMQMREGEKGQYRDLHFGQTVPRRRVHQVRVVSAVAITFIGMGKHHPQCRADHWTERKDGTEAPGESHSDCPICYGE